MRWLMFTTHDTYKCVFVDIHRRWNKKGRSVLKAGSTFQWVTMYKKVLEKVVFLLVFAFSSELRYLLLAAGAAILQWGECMCVLVID